MAETLSFSEYTSGTVAVVGRSAEAIFFSESSSGMISNHGTSTESLSFSEHCRGSLTIQGTAAERIRFGEKSTGPLWGRSRESLSFSEAVHGFSPISGTGRESTRFREHCYGQVVEPSPSVDPVSDDTTAWCVNLATGGHSRYTGALDGSQSEITGHVVTPVSQLGSDRAKYVHDLYIHGRLNSDLTVTTLTDEQKRRSYTLWADNRQGVHRHRLKLAKGLKGSDWQFIISGTGFNLQSVEVPPVISQRVR
jgi:hypothetical protein